MAQKIGTRPQTNVEQRIERLSTASLKKIIEPDVDVPGHVGPGQILPDDLLSVAGLDLDLTAEQRAILSREEVASITAAASSSTAAMNSASLLGK